MKSLQRFFEEANGLPTIINRFYDEFDFKSKFKKSAADTCSTSGLCAKVSTEFIKFAFDNGYPDKIGYIVVEFDRVVGKSPNGTEINHHTAAYVDSSKVVDYTSGQFLNNINKFWEGTKEEWLAYLKKITGAEIADVNIFIKPSDFKDPHPNAE